MVNNRCVRKYLLIYPAGIARIPLTNYLPKIFKKKDGIIFKPEYLLRAKEFYELHGGKTVTLARFIPIVRTFAPIIAGIVKLDFKKFAFY